MPNMLISYMLSISFVCLQKSYLHIVLFYGIFLSLTLCLTSYFIITLFIIIIVLSSILKQKMSILLETDNRRKQSVLRAIFPGRPLIYILTENPLNKEYPVLNPHWFNQFHWLLLKLYPKEETQIYVYFNQRFKNNTQKSIYTNSPQEIQQICTLDND